MGHYKHCSWSGLPVRSQNPLWPISQKVFLVLLLIHKNLKCQNADGRSDFGASSQTAPCRPASGSHASQTQRNQPALLTLLPGSHGCSSPTSFWPSSYRLLLAERQREGGSLATPQGLRTPSSRRGDFIFLSSPLTSA